MRQYTVVAILLVCLAGCSLRKAEQAVTADKGGHLMKIAEAGAGSFEVTIPTKNGPFTAKGGGFTMSIWWPYVYEWFDPLGWFHTDKQVALKEVAAESGP